MPEPSSSAARLVVGLISGTSMDGIDAALVRISGPATRPRVRLLAFETLPYPHWLRERLLAIAGGGSTTAEEIDQLHALLGTAFGQAAVHVCHLGHIKPARLFAVGSHGQTIHHDGSAGMRVFDSASQPNGPQEGSASSSWVLGSHHTRQRSAHPLFGVRGLSKHPGNAADLSSRSALLPIPCTLQIGEAALIAELTGAPVVADFRTADMAAGGQGAPLVPMVDYLLLRDRRQGTVALNIGGIANFTVIPAAAEPEEVFGFDTGPGNMIMDGLVRHFTKGRKVYDAGGRWAATGRVIEPLLAEMLRQPFFLQHPPKSAGREQFGQKFTDQFLVTQQPPANPSQKPKRPIANRKSATENRWVASPEDLLRTAAELTARSIAVALERFVLGKVPVHRLIISGGGAHNRLLMSRLAKLLPQLRIQPSDEFGLAVDAKEAIAFAVLADRTLHGLPGNLPAVTGARRAVVLGKVSRP